MATFIKTWVYNRPGVLDRITGLIRRKGWNIRTLVAGGVDDGLSQIDVVLEGRGLDVQALGEYLVEMDAICSFERCTEQSHLIWEILIFCVHTDKRELVGFGGEAVLFAIEKARLIMERDGLSFYEYSDSAAQVDKVLSTLLKLNIRCVHSGALALALREGDGTRAAN